MTTELRSVKASLVLPFNQRRISPQPYYLENLGIQYVASSLLSAGVDCGVLDADGARMTEAETVAAIEADHPTLIGFSLSIDTAESVFRMCKELRSRNPEVLICLGGQHATYFASDILSQEPSVDFVVLGEGEETMVQVCRSLETESQLPRLERGLAFREAGGVFCGPPALLSDGLDSYPNPERSILGRLRESRQYAMPLILTSRGCPNRCSFCSSHDYFGGVWRTRSPLRVVDEMEEICEAYGYSHFYFADDQILGRGAEDKSHLVEIVAEILHRRLHVRFDLYSFVMMRADFHRVLTAQELADLRLAGFKDIFVGFESGSDKELALFTKGFRGSDYVDTLALKDRFFLEGGFILFHPYTTLDTLRADAQLIQALGVPLWGYYSKRLVPYPGTKLFDKLVREDKLLESDYKTIRYELSDPQVRSIHDAVGKVEMLMGDADDRVFEVVDAYQKARLSERAAGDKFVNDTSRLTEAMSDLSRFYHESFLALLNDSGSDSLVGRIANEAEERVSSVTTEYGVLHKHGVPIG